jgi:hypothetical protein
MAKMTPDEYDKWMLELAIHARNIMRQRGAYLAPEEENETNHGYVNVEEMCEILDIPIRQWGTVKKKMLAMGEPITLDDFGGHYLGKPGSQAKNPAMLITRAMTMLETASYQITALQGLKDWNKCQQMLDSLMTQNRHKLDIGDIPQLLNGAGLKLAEDFDRKLLTSKLDL